MKVEEFIRAVTAADFVKLVGHKRLSEFAKYANAVEDAGGTELVIRILFQIEEDDGVPLPYYLWLVYPLDDRPVDFYPPDFDDLYTYLQTPEPLQGLSYFEITEMEG